jgi:Concanavalin A-like lectin/glucanases superfamily/Bacterial TSP3 repeat
MAWQWNTTSASPSSVPQNNLAGMSGAGFLFDEQFYFTLPKPISGGANPVNYTAIKSLSFWIKPEVSSLTTAQPVFSYVPNGSTYRQTGNSLNPYVMRAMIRPRTAGGYELVFLSWEFTGTQDAVHTGWTLANTQAQFEERWINLIFTYKSGTQSTDGWDLYVNGTQQSRTISAKRGFLQAPAPTPPLEEFFVGADIIQGGAVTRKANKILAGRMDRTQIFNDRLTPSQVTAISNRDTDGDGLNDAEEVTSGSDPAHYDQDVDRDGLTNAEEVAG